MSALDQNILEPEKKKGSLQVLSIFSFLNVLYLLINSIPDFLKGLPENFEDLIYDQMEQFGAEIPEQMMDSLEGFISNLSQNFTSYALFNVIYAILIGISVIMMLKLQRRGFNIYLITCILGIVLIPMFLGSNFVAYVMMAMYSIPSIIFILLYKANLKYMD